MCDFEKSIQCLEIWLINQNRIQFARVRGLVSLAEWVLVTPHQGLGDHILCNGLYRVFSARNKKVFITVISKYYAELSNMLSDCENVTLIRIPNYKSWKTTRILQLLARIIGISVVGLGSYGSEFFPKGVRFDNNFYNQAGVNFKERWESFHVPRNHKKERELLDFLGCEKSKYIFLHEDISRNFIINRNLLPQDLRIVVPLSPNCNFNLVDYRLVLEQAVEIHVIESSFAAFIESITTNNPLIAHRYARPHALHDFRHEFTYTKNWKVII